MLKEALERLTQVLEQRNTCYALMGGLAMALHARPRATKDIDLLLSVPQIELAPLLQSLAARGFTIDLEKNIRELRDDGYTAISYCGLIVDLMRPVIAAYQHALDRAIQLGPLRVLSAEGLIVMKLMALRGQDETDIQDLLAAYAGRLDLDFIRAEMDTFCAPDDPRRAKLEAWARQSQTEGGP
jgi:hypothetical protein